MSKIEFYRELKNKLKDDYPESLKIFIQDYINNLTVLPSIEDALDFIQNNYKQPMPSPSPKKGSEFNNPWADLGIPGFGPSYNLQETLNSIKKKKQGS